MARKPDPIKQAVCNMAFDQFKQGHSEDRMPNGYEIKEISPIMLQVRVLPADVRTGPRYFTIKVSES